MQIQSLSVVVPATCPNRCPFCVSRFNKANQAFTQGTDLIDSRTSLKTRMTFARDNGCNTLMITSTGEVFKNPTYVNTILYCNSVLKSPFKWIELQTSGYGLSEHFIKSGLAKEVSWVSLSMIDPVNLKANQHAMGLTFKMEDVFSLLKEHDINMRLSLNLTDIYSEFKRVDWKNLLKKIFEKGFKQVTFRILYSDSSDKEQSNWIKKHGLGENTEAIVALQEYIRQEGYLLGKLPFGVAKYSIEGMCTIIDDDCMAQSVKDIDTYKSLILRQDGRLYTSWADNASLLF